MNSKKLLPVWPVVVLAIPAAVAIWSGWVGLGGLTGFGEVALLPGIVDFKINTAITLPIGMEAYAAYALRVWLADGDVYEVSDRARVFAKWSSIGALILGALGQVTFHLLAAAGVTSAGDVVTAVVSCLPVGVLGLGAALAHLLRDGAVSDGVVAESVVEPVSEPVFPTLPIVSVPTTSWPVFVPEPVLVAAAERLPEPTLNGSAGTTVRARDIVREPSVVSADDMTPRKFILDTWRQGNRVTSSDLYERFPERKRESLRSVLSTVRRDNTDLEPPDRTAEGVNDGNE